MNIQEFNTQFPDEETCSSCGGMKSWNLSSEGRRLGLYECAACGKQFTITTKTPLHGTKLPLRIWLMAMYFMINSSKGISSVFLAKWIGTSQKTAWKIGHAVRAIMASQADAMPGLSGAVELDEKYINHGAKEYVNGNAHNNTVESFNAILERAKWGVFHSLSKQHLQRYVSEVVFRWNHREPAKEITKNGIKKIIFKAKPILEQLRSLLRYAVGTQLRRSFVGGIFIQKPAFRL